MKKKRILTPDLVKSAAVDLVCELGYEELSVQAMADRLNIKPASLYNHIKGLGELQLYVALQAIKQLEDTTRNAAVGYSGKDAIMAIASAYRNFAKDNPGLYQAFILSAAQRETEFINAGKSLVKVLLKIVEPYMSDEVEKTHFQRMFRSVLHGFVSLELAGFFKGSPSADASFVHCVEMIANTLGERIN